MAGTIRIPTLALSCLALALSSTAHADYGYYYARSCYYVPPPICGEPYGYVPRTWSSEPIERVSPPRPKDSSLATPLPAPPSFPKANAEPPTLPRRAPIINEMRSMGGAFPQTNPNVGAGRCRVGFWNLAGRDINLTIDGRAVTLNKDRAVTVDLERAFVWQVDGGVMQTERVPDDQAIFEVIIRQ